MILALLFLSVIMFWPKKFASGSHGVAWDLADLLTHRRLNDGWWWASTLAGFAFVGAFVAAVWLL